MSVEFVEVSKGVARNSTHDIPSAVAHRGVTDFSRESEPRSFLKELVEARRQACESCNFEKLSSQMTCDSFSVISLWNGRELGSVRGKMIKLQ